MERSFERVVGVLHAMATSLEEAKESRAVTPNTSFAVSVAVEELFLAPAPVVFRSSHGPHG